MLFLIIDKTNNTHVSVLTLEVFVVVLFSFTRSKFVHCYTILFLLIKIPVILLGIGCVMHIAFCINSFPPPLLMPPHIQCMGLDELCFWIVFFRLCTCSSGRHFWLACCRLLVLCCCTLYYVVFRYVIWYVSLYVDICFFCIFSNRLLVTLMNCENHQLA